MTTLHIVAIGTGEAHALRAAAEYWRAFVTVTWVGNSGQIVEYFSKCPVHDLIIIAGHGDERGLLPSARRKAPAFMHGDERRAAIRQTLAQIAVFLQPERIAR